MKPRILAFAGSTRKESYNKQLINIAAAGVREAGGDVTVIDLREFPLPLYDGDLEKAEGVPVHAQTLKKLFKEHHALILASPEYNSSISGVLKNAIDWVSRPFGNEKPMEPFANKLALLFSASPGAMGGMRGLVHLRSILGNMKVLVLPEQLAVSNAEEGLKSEEKQRTIKSMAAILVNTTAKLIG